MTEQNQDNGQSRPAPRVLRLLGAVTTVIALIGLLFFVMLVETRDQELSIRRDVAYGELKRIEHKLRDISDLSRISACRKAKSGNPKEGTRYELTDESVVSLTANEEQRSSKQEALAEYTGSCTLEDIALTFEGQQSRDSRIVLTTLAVGAGEPDRNDKVQEQLGDNSHSHEVTDVAIVGPGWRVALPLRGDVAWPAELGPILDNGQPLGWERPDSSDRSDDAAEDSEDSTERTTRPLSGPVTVNIGGDEVVVHAIPLNLRRAIKIGGPTEASGAVVCRPRECSVVGLTRQDGLIENVAKLSPLTRASFVAAIALLLLLIPLTKLWLIERRSSLRWTEVAAIIGSVPLAISTTFVISLCWAQWLELRADFDFDAKYLSGEIAKNLDEEVGALAKFAFDGQPEDAAARAVDGLYEVDENGVLNPLVSNRPTAGDSEGVPPAALPTVLSREYFRRARSGDYDSSVEDNAGGYATAILPSLLRSDSVLVAMTVTNSDPNNFAARIAERPPLTTNQVPLPEGFGFAVVDPDTLEVLQHSDADRAGTERWDDRVDDVPQLEQYIDSAMSRCSAGDESGQLAIEPIALRYIGEKVRASAAPACSGGWVIMTWYPSAMVERLAIEPAMLPIGLILLFGLAIAVISFAVGWFDKQRLIALYWPAEYDRSADNDANKVERLSDAELLTLFGPIILLSLLQTLILRGDAAFLQIFALMGASLVLLATPLVTGGLDSLYRKAFHVVGILAYVIFTIWAWSKLDYVATQFRVYFLLASVICAASLASLFSPRIFHRASSAFRHVLRRFLVEIRLGRLADGFGNWLTNSRGINKSIAKQAVFQALIVTLLSVLPTILAHRAGSASIRHDLVHLDQTSISAAQENRGAWLARKLDAPTGDEQNDWLANIGEWAAAQPAERVFDNRVDRFYGHEIAASEDQTAFTFPEANRSSALLGRALGENLDLIDVPLERQNYAMASLAPGSTESQRLEFLVRRSGQVLPFVIVSIFGLFLYAYLCKALYGMGLFEFRSLHPRPEFEEDDIVKMSNTSAGSPPPLRLYINYPFDKFEQLKNTLEGMNGYNFVDLSRVDDAEAQLASVRTRNRPWIVVGLMRVIGAPDLRRQALDFLERLLDVEGAQVHFFSEMLPIERLQQVRELERISSSGDAAQRDIDNLDEARHWALLLAQFVTVRWDSFWELRQSRVADIVGDDTPQSQWLDDLIEAEFESIPNDLVRKQRESFLEELETKAKDDTGEPKAGRNPTLLYRAYPADNQPLREQVIEYLANVLSDYYQMKWIGSTREEQILMFHLANGRFVKTTDFRTINSLINRDLVKRDPNLKLMNESFAFWVRTNENPQTFYEYRQMVEQASPWAQLRMPMLIFVVVAAGALAYLDQGTVGSVISLIPAIAAAIPVFASQAGQSRAVAPS